MKYLYQGQGALLDRMGRPRQRDVAVPVLLQSVSTDVRGTAWSDLEMALRKARTEGRAADVQEAEVTARVQKVEAQADQRVQEASAERERLRDSLEDMKQALAQQESKIDRTELDAIREELLTRVAEAEDVTEVWELGKAGKVRRVSGLGTVD